MEVVLIKEKYYLSVLSKSNFPSCKDNTFRSSNPRITKRINQIIGKKACTQNQPASAIICKVIYNVMRVRDKKSS